MIRRMLVAIGVLALLWGGVCGSSNCLAEKPATEALRLAITDLVHTFGERYPRGAEYLERLAALEARVDSNDGRLTKRMRAKLDVLAEQALLEHPLLDFDRLIVVKRKNNATLGRRRGLELLPKYAGDGFVEQSIGMVRNDLSNTSLAEFAPNGFDDQIMVLEPARPGGTLTTLYRNPAARYVGEVDLHFEADRLLFSMADEHWRWKIYEIGVDQSGLRQVTRDGLDDVDNYDACYLPSERIVFASTASYQGVPCWSGIPHRVAHLYVMDPDGSAVRQLCFDQDHDWHPSVLSNGQVAYSRWDYTGVRHEYLRELMVMNPDGTGQRAMYGSNSWFPNSLFFGRAIPGHPNKVVAILGDYHGVPRMGDVVVLDLSKGWHGADGMLARIPSTGEKIEAVIVEKLVLGNWPKFLHPYPISDKVFLAACRPTPQHDWGIYLVDVFGNRVLICEEPGYALLEPVPVRKTARPPVVPDRVDPRRDDAVVYLHDVYAGPGLAGVPRGTVERLRVAAYHFCYPGIGGTNKVGMGGPWEVIRILGTVPVYEDGSAAFRVPANTALAVQPLDAEGKALQLMRSWFTAMPGETISCVGCHERQREIPKVRWELASLRKPMEIEPWHGPARGFDFEREVQPVLDEYCVACHDGQAQADGSVLTDLRSEAERGDYPGQWLHPTARQRMKRAAGTQHTGSIRGERIRYAPAYDALMPYIRRGMGEDGLDMLVPCEYHADTSELVQMLLKGHHNVRLDREAWERLVTWIDLNAPCHGTWNEVYPIPGGADRRRLELQRRFGGPKEDPEAVPPVPHRKIDPVMPDPIPKPEPRVVEARAWPFDAEEAKRRQKARGRWRETIELGGGVKMELVRIPPGEFVMGSAEGEVDEFPPTPVRIQEAFWMGTCEVTNRQFRRFEPSHQSGYCSQHGMTKGDSIGLTLDEPDQPVVRVSWQRADEFCRWLSERTGKRVMLPTEAQWEYACRAGTTTPLACGGLEDDFSMAANLADNALAEESPFGPFAVRRTCMGWAVGEPCLRAFDDGAVVTAPVGRRQRNAWGLRDMHGNAAEWTQSTYRPYPYREDDGPGDETTVQRKVVRGGAWCDRPHRARSAFRLSYPAWQRVHNVGFRVVVLEPEA